MTRMQLGTFQLECILEGILDVQHMIHMGMQLSPILERIEQHHISYPESGSSENPVVCLSQKTHQIFIRIYGLIFENRDLDSLNCPARINR